MNLLKAKELESKAPKIKKKTNLAYQSYEITDPRFQEKVNKQDFFVEDKNRLGQFGEMGSYDFEDEEGCIKRFEARQREKKNRQQIRKGESFYIHREDEDDSNALRKFSMMLPKKNRASFALESKCIF